MGRRFTRAVPGAHGAEPEPAGPCAHDIHWAGERRSAIGVASLLSTVLFAMDAGSGRIDVTRGVLWTALAGLLFAILLPPKVSVCPGVLSARGMLMTDTVRTDCLISVRWSDGVAQRMILQDTQGSQVEIDPTVLVRNPAMWHLLDTDSRTSIQRGTLRRGTTALQQLARRIDRETARTVFRVSGFQ